MNHSNHTKDIVIRRNPSTDISDRMSIDTTNPRRRCPVALVLDTSGTMAGEPIAELQRGVDNFITDILRDDVARSAVELTVITFGGETPQVAMPFQTFQDAGSAFSPLLVAEGRTPMGAALERAHNEVTLRKRMLQATGIGYYQPWIVLLTDGYPTDEWRPASELIQPLAKDKKLLFLGFGVGPDADLEVLHKFCASWCPPRLLKGTQFRPMFRFIMETLHTQTRRGFDESNVSTLFDDEEADEFSIEYEK